MWNWCNQFEDKLRTPIEIYIAPVCAHTCVYVRNNLARFVTESGCRDNKMPAIAIFLRRTSSPSLGSQNIGIKQLAERFIVARQ